MPFLFFSNYYVIRLNPAVYRDHDWAETKAEGCADAFGEVDMAIHRCPNLLLSVSPMVS
jgi:hypothetical protein